MLINEREKILQTANYVVVKLEPNCERIQICGSIRRNKAHINDIDIVCIPKRKAILDLFGEPTTYIPIEPFRNQIDSWEKIKGEATGKYTQRIVEGIKVEISICTEETFHIISLIRTGDADFTHMLMTRVNKCGLQQHEGLLWDEERVIPIHSEQQYFAILDLPYVEPAFRNKDAFKKVKK